VQQFQLIVQFVSFLVVRARVVRARVVGSGVVGLG
jgi:hypothetical protein